MKQIVMVSALVALAAVPAIAAYQVHDVISTTTIKAPCGSAKIALLDWFAGKPMNWTGIIGAAILVAAAMWAFDKFTEN